MVPESVLRGSLPRLEWHCNLLAQVAQRPPAHLALDPLLKFAALARGDIPLYFTLGLPIPKSP
ncbi:MAG: hypothetical protein NTY23_13995, partial [Chloroflexi bacterium]|nr:hypothetical protein [Chloroflexota bacterium]